MIITTAFLELCRTITIIVIKIILCIVSFIMMLIGVDAIIGDILHKTKIFIKPGILFVTLALFIFSTIHLI